MRALALLALAAAVSAKPLYRLRPRQGDGSSSAPAAPTPSPPIPEPGTLEVGALCGAGGGAACRTRVCYAQGNGEATCRPNNLGPTAACREDYECASFGCIQGQCVVNSGGIRSENGQPCQGNGASCLSGICKPPISGSGESLCRPSGVAFGGDCVDSVQCATSACDLTAGKCASSTPVPADKLDDGAECGPSGGSACKSGVCLPPPVGPGNSTCRPSGLAGGRDCVGPEQCASGVCDTTGGLFKCTGPVASPPSAPPSAPAPAPPGSPPSSPAPSPPGSPPSPPPPPPTGSPPSPPAGSPPSPPPANPPNGNVTPSPVLNQVSTTSTRSTTPLSSPRPAGTNGGPRIADKMASISFGGVACAALLGLVVF